MAFRHPPPHFGKLSEQRTTVMNFNIPPPEFKSSYTNEAHQHHLPPQPPTHLPPPPYIPLPRLPLQSLPPEGSVLHLPPQGPSSQEPLSQWLLPPPSQRPSLQWLPSQCPPLHGPQPQWQPPPQGPPPQLLPSHAVKEDFNDKIPENILEESANSIQIIPHAPQWIREWLHKIKSHCGNITVQETSQTLKIHEAKHMLKKCINNLKALKELQESLDSNYEGASASLWNEKWDQVNSLKVQVDGCLKILDNPESLSALKKALMKRSKKRKREKKKRIEYKEERAEYHARRQQLHENIDKWLMDMQEVVERAKREESLKHEADQVLSEVTHRKNEARRQLNMLKALQKLRRIRKQTYINRGQHVDGESGIRFTRVVEHLLKLWADQLKEYETEEQGLRVMLDEAVEERTKFEISQIKHNLHEWEEILFGKRGPRDDFYQAAEKELESFIEVRKSWDNFLAPPGAVMTSAVPVGWVLPSHPSSNKWEKLLTKNN